MHMHIPCSFSLSSPRPETPSRLAPPYSASSSPQHPELQEPRLEPVLIPRYELEVPGHEQQVSKPAPLPAELEPGPAGRVTPPAGGPQQQFEWIGNPMLEPLLGRKGSDDA